MFFVSGPDLFPPTLGHRLWFSTRCQPQRKGCTDRSARKARAGSEACDTSVIEMLLVGLPAPANCVDRTASACRHTRCPDPKDRELRNRIPARQRDAIREK